MNLRAGKSYLNGAGEIILLSYRSRRRAPTYISVGGDWYSSEGWLRGCDRPETNLVKEVKTCYVCGETKEPMEFTPGKGRCKACRSDRDYVLRECRKNRALAALIRWPAPLLLSLALAGCACVREAGLVAAAHAPLNAPEDVAIVSAAELLFCR